MTQGDFKLELMELINGASVLEVGDRTSFFIPQAEAYPQS